MQESTGAQTEAERAEAWEPFEAFAQDCLDRGIWTGGVIAAGTLAGESFRRAWGWMDTDKAIPMPDNALFDLASVTKAVGTTTALALCMDRGLLDPDAPFTVYLPDYRGKLIERVSIRDLARHLSGFPNQKPYDVVGEVMDRILDFSPVRAPGPPYEYSCGNFILLGLIVERLLDADLDTICRREIFGPLGMRDTRWAPLPDPDPARVVRSAECAVFGLASDPPARNAQHPTGNAGLFSTVEDLGAFSRMMIAGGALNGRRVLSEDAVKFLCTWPDSCSPASFGWRLDPQYNPAGLSPVTLSHTGWAGNSLWIDMAHQRYVALLTNRSGNHDAAQHVRRELAARLVHALWASQ
ncbi:MAG: serine hydrolase [Kiritimatiellae bacterium]|nr:serine hydrolase [Kiritimatiellia bacterium]